MKKIALLISLTMLSMALLCSCTDRMNNQNGNDTHFAETNGDSMFDKDDGTINDTDTDGFINDTDNSNDSMISPDTNTNDTNSGDTNTNDTSSENSSRNRGNMGDRDTSIIEGIF